MSDATDTLDRLRADFDAQVEQLLEADLEEEVHLKDHGIFPKMFDTHIDRLRQLLTLVRNLGLEDNMWSGLFLVTASIEGGYKEPDLVPALRQEADYIWVGFEEPPMFLEEIGGGYGEATEFLSVASIPLFPGDKIPFEGKNVLLTTSHESAEIVFGSYNPEDESIVFVWGDKVIESLNAQFPDENTILN